jgi:hypothetical protein
MNARVIVIGSRSRSAMRNAVVVFLSSRALPTLAALALAGVALAHHSFIGRFDLAKVEEIEGVVTDLAWRNPHAVLSVRSTGADGAATDWSIETSSLTVLRRMGIEESTIKVGDRIKLAGNPSALGKKEMYARNLLLPDGRELLLNVGLKPRWTQNAVGDESLLMAQQGDPSAPELGIFRVWSHTRAIARLFPEATDPSFDIQSYPMTPAARSALAKFDGARDNPIANCVAKGMPTIMEAPYPIEFVHAPNGNLLLKIEEYDLERTIDMHATAPPPGTAATPLGFSVGHWDGKTLVVTTTRVSWPWFSQRGIPQSPGVAIVERFTPTADGSRLDYEMTVTDAVNFTRPVVLSTHWFWLPNVHLMPYHCATQ